MKYTVIETPPSKAATPPVLVLDHEGNGVTNPEFTIRELRGFVYENALGELAGTHGRCEGIKRRRFR